MNLGKKVLFFGFLFGFLKSKLYICYVRKQTRQTSKEREEKKEKKKIQKFGILEKKM